MCHCSRSKITRTFRGRSMHRLLAINHGTVFHYDGIWIIGNIIRTHACQKCSPRSTSAIPEHFCTVMTSGSTWRTISSATAPVMELLTHWIRLSPCFFWCSVWGATIYVHQLWVIIRWPDWRSQYRSTTRQPVISSVEVHRTSHSHSSPHPGGEAREDNPTRTPVMLTHASCVHQFSCVRFSSPQWCAWTTVKIVYFRIWASFDQTLCGAIYPHWDPWSRNSVDAQTCWYKGQIWENANSHLRLHWEICINLSACLCLCSSGSRSRYAPLPCLHLYPSGLSDQHLTNIWAWSGCAESSLRPTKYLGRGRENEDEK